MRFLILTSGSVPPPPEMMGHMIGAMRTWMSEQRDSGRVVTDFALAGKPGGGAIIEVSSHEELDGAMAGFPFAPFSDIQIHALADLDASLDNTEAAFQKMAQMVGV